MKQYWGRVGAGDWDLFESRVPMTDRSYNKHVEVKSYKYFDARNVWTEQGFVKPKIKNKPETEQNLKQSNQLQFK